MTELDQFMAKAFASEGKQEDVNKVYLALLRATLYVPVEKRGGEFAVDPEEPFRPLFASVEDKFVMLAFDELARLENWAGDEYEKMDYVELVGRDVIAGIGEAAYLCLNVGTTFYKEFSPDEIKKLKMIVSRIDQMKGQK